MLLHTFYPISPSNYALWQYHASDQTILTEYALGRLNFHSRSSFVPRIDFLRGEIVPGILACPGNRTTWRRAIWTAFPWKGERGQAVEREGRTEAGHVFFHPRSALFALNAAQHGGPSSRGGS